MKTTITLLSLSTILVCLAASAQTQQRAAGGGLAERFKQLDRSGDGKVSREEGVSLQFFDAADKNKDGFLTVEEVQAYFAARRTVRPAAPEQPAAPERRTPSAPQTPAAGPQMVETRDVRYVTATGVDANLQSLDIQAPKGAKNAPVIVGFHGGGWRGGDKRSFGRLAEVFTAAGYVFVSGNYRLAPAAKHPALVEDVAAALAWVQDHIAEHGGDPKRIFVTGHSAGAHLAALVAVDERYLKKAGKDLSLLKGAVLLDAAGYDLVAYLASPEATAGMTDMIHQGFGKTEAGWRDGSPTEHVAKGKSIPPFLILYGGTQFGSATGAPLLADKLKGAGVAAQAVKFAKGHQDFALDLQKPDDPMTKLVMEFLATHSRVRTALNWLTYEEDYRAGRYDKNGKYMGGTDLMHLVGHKGVLYAGTAVCGDPVTTDPLVGAQVFKKTGPNAEWEVDTTLGVDYRRIDALYSVRFTTDYAGKPLNPQPEVLVSSPWHDVKNGQVTVWTRNEKTGHWTRVVVGGDMYGNDLPGAEKSFRLFFDHKDAKTGIHYLFAGHGINGSIWKGAYNPTVPGEIQWDTKPDRPGVVGKSGRVLGLAEADGVLYAAIRPDMKDHSTRGIFRRTDGNPPEWEKVYQWPIPPEYKGTILTALRGLTGIRAPDGSHDILLANNQSVNTVIRIDPANGFRDSIEMNVRDFFENLWGELKYPRPGGAIQGCYNFMTPFVHPTSGEKMNILNFQVFPGGPDRPMAHASHFFLRHVNGQYEYGAALDMTKPIPPRMLLDVARTVAVSPFPQDGVRVIYFGGPDVSITGRHNTAWIYKATVKNHKATIKEKP